jgi:hypothetical protein
VIMLNGGKIAIDQPTSAAPHQPDAER